MRFYSRPWKAFNVKAVGQVQKARGQEGGLAPALSCTNPTLSNPKDFYLLADSKKYFATVASDGFRVIIDTTIINSAETITIGTTGMKPNTAVPPGVRVSTSKPETDQTSVGGPGAGAGTACWKIATATTEAAVQIVTASAPHFVLPFQNNAATSKGDKAA